MRLFYIYKKILYFIATIWYQTTIYGIILTKSVKDKGIRFENTFEVDLTEGKIKSDFAFECKDTEVEELQSSEQQCEDKTEKAHKIKKENDEVVGAHSSSSNNLYALQVTLFLPLLYHIFRKINTFDKKV